MSSLAIQLKASITAGLIWAPLALPTGEMAISAPRASKDEPGDEPSPAFARQNSRHGRPCAEHNNDQRQRSEHQEG